MPGFSGGVGSSVGGAAGDNGGSGGQSWNPNKPNGSITSSITGNRVNTYGAWQSSKTNTSNGSSGRGGNNGGYATSAQAAAAAKAAAAKAAAAAAAAKAKQVATGQETARVTRTQQLLGALQVNQQRMATDSSPQRAAAARSAVSAIQTELNDLATKSQSYMQQYAPDQLKAVADIGKEGSMISAATGTKVSASTQAANAAMGVSETMHPTVLSVLGEGVKGFAKGFMSGGVPAGLALGVWGMINQSGALTNLSLQGTDQTGKTMASSASRPVGPGQTLVNGQEVGNGNGGGGWRPSDAGVNNPLAPGFTSSGGQSAGITIPGGTQTNEQAYNQYMGLLQQREKANSLTTNAGWMGGSGSSLLGRWAATQGGRGGASGTEYSPLATGPTNLYG